MLLPEDSVDGLGRALVDDPFDLTNQADQVIDGRAAKTLIRISKSKAEVAAKKVVLKQQAEAKVGQATADSKASFIAE